MKYIKEYLEFDFSDTIESSEKYMINILKEKFRLNKYECKILIYFYDKSITHQGIVNTSAKSYYFIINNTIGVDEFIKHIKNIIKIDNIDDFLKYFEENNLYGSAGLAKKIKNEISKIGSKNLAVASTLQFKFDFTHNETDTSPLYMEFINVNSPNNDLKNIKSSEAKIDYLNFLLTPEIKKYINILEKDVSPSIMLREILYNMKKLLNEI